MGGVKNAYYECWLQSGKQYAYKKKMIELKEELMKHKPEVNLYNPGWKTKIFYLSPSLYCNLVCILHTSRDIKYKIRVWLTGKN